jgi:hypothetical protein
MPATISGPGLAASVLLNPNLPKKAAKTEAAQKLLDKARQ